MNLLQIIFLALLGLSAGMIVAGGVFSFIVELGVISDFADRTHTGNHILIYEDNYAMIIKNKGRRLCLPNDST